MMHNDEKGTEAVTNGVRVIINNALDHLHVGSF